MTQDAGEADLLSIQSSATSAGVCLVGTPNRTLACSHKNVKSGFFAVRDVLSIISAELLILTLLMASVRSACKLPQSVGSNEHLAYTMHKMLKLQLSTKVVSPEQKCHKTIVKRHQIGAQTYPGFMLLLQQLQTFIKLGACNVSKGQLASG